MIILEKGHECYAIAFGAAHFYVRPYCDYDFGVELAKRIADEDDITETAARRYQGKQRKHIRSFSHNTRLRVPPGNSVDFLKGRILESMATGFGPSGKFGTSCLLSPDITSDELGTLLSQVNDELAHATRIKLPRSYVALRNDASVTGRQEVVAAGPMDAATYEHWVAGYDADTDIAKGTISKRADAVRFVEVVVNGPKTWSLAAALHPEIAAAYGAAQDRAAREIVTSLAEQTRPRSRRNRRLTCGFSEWSVGDSNP